MSSSNSRFGYDIVAAAFIAQAVAMGLSLGMYPVLMESIEIEFEVTRTQTSFGIPLVVLVGTLFAPLLGRLVDQGSPRVLMCTGAVLMSLGLWGLSIATNLTFVLICWIGLVGVGQAMLGILPCATVVANWFVVRRGVMVAISAAGVTFGIAISPILTEFLIDSLGWRDAIKSLGAICFIIAVPVTSLMIVKKPADKGMFPDGIKGELLGLVDKPPVINLSIFQIIQDHRFWLVSISLSFFAAVPTGLNTHIVGWAVELDMGRDFGIALLSMAAISSALGGIMCGILCDRIGAKNTLLLVVLVQSLGWGTMLVANTNILFTLGLIVFFSGAGCFIPCQASLAGKIWPIEMFGTIIGVIGLVVLVGVVLVPPAIGYGFESTGGYRTPMLYTFSLVLLPVLFLFILNNKAIEEVQKLKLNK